MVAAVEEFNFKSKAAGCADVTIDLRRSEVDVESVADRMAKDEARLSGGSASPKELEQLQHEIATLSKRKAELEDGELEIMMIVDAAKEKVATIKSDEEGLKKLELELNIRLENSVTEIDREIALKKSERTLLVPKIDAALVELYEKVKGTGGGVGAALLIGNTCDGCRLAINAVEMERIKSLDSEEVLRCKRAICVAGSRRGQTWFYLQFNQFKNCGQESFFRLC